MFPNQATQELDMVRVKASIQPNKKLIPNIFVSSHFSAQKIRKLQENSDIMIGMHITKHA